MLLTGMKPLSDEEWFASLAPTKRSEEEREGAERTAQGHTARFHRHNHSSGSATSSKAGLHRDVSTKTTGSEKEFDPDEMAQEPFRRRRRERVLQKVSRTHKMAASPHIGNAMSEKGSPVPTSGGNGPGGTQGTGEDLEHEEEVDGGEFVNYQVGFEYRRPGSSKKHAWGLHVLVSLRLILFLYLSCSLVSMVAD